MPAQKGLVCAVLSIKCVCWGYAPAPFSAEDGVVGGHLCGEFVEGLNAMQGRMIGVLLGGQLQNGQDLTG
eukprot:170259-Karenia_brevis.AAC.1